MSSRLCKGSLCPLCSRKSKKIHKFLLEEIEKIIQGVEEARIQLRIPLNSPLAAPTRKTQINFS